MINLYLNVDEFLRYYALPLLAAALMLLARIVLVVVTRLDRKANARKFEQRLEEFQPGPLVEAEGSAAFREIPVVPNAADSFDLAKADYLSLANDSRVLNSAAGCIGKYGVGTCGPRAFYGGTDLHLALESRLARFLGKPDAIVYAYGYTTVSSSVRCYCKPGTVVFLDEFVKVAIVQGVAASRCKKVMFAHNDAVDFASKVGALRRSELIFDELKLLIVEGIYLKDGSICAFDELLRVCKRYKVRILVDEAVSFGVLGEHGRGVTEHFNVGIDEVDVTIGSLEHALVSYGGFCVGSKLTIEHQRLSSAGYNYSASLPTYSVQAAITALDLIDGRPRQLMAVSVKVHDFMSDIRQLLCLSDPESPVKVFTVKNDDERKRHASKLHRFFLANQVYVLEWEGGLKMNLYVDLGEPSKLEKFFGVFTRAVDACLE